MTTKEEQCFKEAEIHWDMERLLDDLADVKGRALTAKEKLVLQGLLCGHTSADLAEIRVKSENGQRTDVSRGAGRYVKQLMRLNGYEVPERMSAAEMLNLLKRAGYKRTAGVSREEMEQILPIKNLECPASNSSDGFCGPPPRHCNSLI